jgi:dihydrodipicolinate synthase/N-acetylneuraminate lyase
MWTSVRGTLVSSQGALWTPAPLAARLRAAGGPLFFHVTAYGRDGSLDLDVCRAHVRRGRRGRRGGRLRVLRGRGYAVSPVKAGIRLSGLEAGEVRPPLHEPAEDHVRQFAQVIERGYALLEEETA